MKLLFVNGSRGEWGYIRPIIKECQKRSIDYSICATNMLLLPDYGYLVEEIENDGFKVDHKIYMSIDGNTHFSMAKSLGLFLISFVDVIYINRPDWIVIAGDRGEQLMAAIAGAYTYIPTAHIQAGEKSGNIDGTTRHAIGKFAHIHFAANQDAADRLLNLGEQSFRIQNVGAPQLDEINQNMCTSLPEINSKFNLKTGEDYVLVVLHPVTEDVASLEDQTSVILKVLSEFDLRKICIMSNNDAGSDLVRESIYKLKSGNLTTHYNLRREDYLGLLKNCKAIIGNSSSGILEAPTFKVPAVNIGRRQNERVQGKNVINCSFNETECIDAINKALSSQFRESLHDCVNPYGDGNSSEKIIKVLQNTVIDDKLLVKNLTH